VYEHIDLSLIDSDLFRHELVVEQAPPPTRRRDERVLRIAVGLSACPPQGCACHQFPFRGATVPGRSVSNTGITFFRVYRHEIAKDEVEIHEGQ
jgi:hypothetical protein